MTDSTAPTTAPDGNGTTNTRPDSFVKVLHDPEPMLYFRPETGEFILVPAEDAGALQAECNLLHDRVEKYHQANEKLDQALQAFSAKQNDTLADPREFDKNKAKIDSAMQVRKSAHEDLKEVLKPLSKLDSLDLTMVELIPLYVNQQGQKHSWFKKSKLHYARSNKIKPGWHTYGPAAFEDMKGRKSEKETGQKSFLKKNAAGKYKIDMDKLKEGELFDEKSPKTAQFFGKLKVSAGVAAPPISGALTEWARAWNQELKYSSESEEPAQRNESAQPTEKKERQVSFENNVKVEAQAQLLRYLAGAGLSTEWEPKKGRVAIKASAQAEFAVAEGKVSGAFLYPDKVGWLWSLDSDDGKKTFPLGAVRFNCELGLSGMVGASAVAQLGVVVDYKDEKRNELGLYGAAINSPTTKQREIKVGSKPVDPSANADLDVFVGARADLKLEGALEWREPGKKCPEDYKAFASVGDTVTAMAGGGLTFMLDISYTAGRFRIKMKAGLCLGIGAKGDVEVSVDALRIAEFFKWFFYQLYHADFNRLKFVKTDAFKAYTHIQVLVIQGVADLNSFIGIEAEDIKNQLDTLIEKYEQEEMRVKLMESVLENPWMLRYATPEAKGIMIFQLTRHWYAADGLDPENHAFGRWYGRRKDAVVQILRWSHTKRDFSNVVEHMTSDGSPGDPTKNRAALANFMNMSLSGNSTGEDKQLQDFYQNLEAMLKMDPTPGYAVAQVGSNDYSEQMALGTHPLYTNMADISAA